jgi:hypothetical protein
MSATVAGTTFRPTPSYTTLRDATPEQIERRRARARVANLTPAQIDRKRAYDRSYYSKKKAQ